MYKEQIEYIDYHIGFERVANLLRFGNVELLDNIFVMDFISNIINKCKTLYTSDTEKTLIYKAFILCWNINNCIEFFKINNIGYKEKQPNGRQRFSYDYIYNTIAKHDYYDLEINLIAYLMLFRKNSDMDFVNEQVNLIKNHYDSIIPTYHSTQDDADQLNEDWLTTSDKRIMPVKRKYGPNSVVKGLCGKM